MKTGKDCSDNNNGVCGKTGSRCSLLPTSSLSSCSKVSTSSKRRRGKK